MSGKKRTYTELKKQMTVEQFELFCKKLATRYANSEKQFSCSYFVKTENITKSCFYRILGEAIIRNLVSEEIVRKMEEKSLFNQKQHVQKAGITTLKHYGELRIKRDEKIISQYTEEDIKKLAEDFAQNPEKTKEEIAKKYGITRTALQRLLNKAFVGNIVDDDICKAMEKRSLEKNPSETIKYRFKLLWEARLALRKQEHSPNK